MSGISQHPEMGSASSCTRRPFQTPPAVVEVPRGLNGRPSQIKIRERDGATIWDIKVVRLDTFPPLQAVNIQLGPKVGLCPWYEEMKSWISSKASLKFTVKVIAKREMISDFGIQSIKRITAK